MAQLSPQSTEKPNLLMNNENRIKIEAAAFRHLLDHLRERDDVQNIDLMNLAGFCRNCLSKWYRAAATEYGEELTDPEARELIYGMPYTEWKDRHQTPATAEQLEKFTENKPVDAK